MEQFTLKKKIQISNSLGTMGRSVGTVIRLGTGFIWTISKFTSSCYLADAALGPEDFPRCSCDFSRCRVNSLVPGRSEVSPFLVQPSPFADGDTEAGERKGPAEAAQRSLTFVELEPRVPDSCPCPLCCLQLWKLLLPQLPAQFWHITSSSCCPRACSQLTNQKP